jgi:hypothetical protein
MSYPCRAGGWARVLFTRGDAMRSSALLGSMSREARAAVAQLSTDGQFLEHVREILRFFKSA